MDISELLAFSVKNKASDLHLSAGLPPMIRVHGDVRRINLPPLEHKDVHAMIYDIMNDWQRKHYEETYESTSRSRCRDWRASASMRSCRTAAPARCCGRFRRKVLSLEELAAPKVFAEFAMKPRGLVLVTGPTGSGKSTTLAAMLDHVNSNVHGHILTVEDPIEFVHEPQASA